MRGSNGIIANVLNCDIEISEFEIQSFCYIHFRTNAHGKGWNLQISPVMD